MPEPVNLFDYDRPALEAFFQDAGHKPYRARQVMKWVYHRGLLDAGAMTDLSKALRGWLGEVAGCKLPEVLTRRQSLDGTVKWLLRVGNGNCVEAVLIPERSPESVAGEVPERSRNTLCVSSQIGCMLDCSFCATGKQGFNGNLTTADIIGQVWLANEELRGRGEAVSNVVFMGMGEPLLNFDAVLRAANLMMDDLAFGISKRRVTISTAGVVPAIHALAGRTDVSLAVSLHAPNDALRSTLVPLNRKYPIAELLAACNRYVAGLGERRVLTMEYTLLRGINDSLGHARELAGLLRPVRCKVNLIPFNPFPASAYERPDEGAVRVFQKHLMDAGLPAMLRTTRGDDIEAACGQLTGLVTDRTHRQARYLARASANGGVAL